MEVKVQCECGTRFAFDVQPVNGRMPVRVKCPDCGADGTDFANEVIRQKLAPAPAAVPVAVMMPVAAASPPPVPPPIPSEPPAPAQQSLRVAGAQPQTAAAPGATASITYCPRHLKNPAVETCRVCGKPICGECMELHGYVCSTYCRKRAESEGMEVPVYGKQRAVVEARVARVGALIWRAAVVVTVVLLGTWIWYTFFGSHPRVIYSEKLAHGDRARFYQFLVPGQVLLIKANQMSLFDVPQQKRLWSVPLDVGFSPPPKPDPSMPDVEEETELYPEPHVIATTNDLWILFPGRLIQYDRRSGNSKQEIPLTPPFFGLAQNDRGITFIASDESEHRTITRIAFADGVVQTEPIQFVNAASLPATNKAKPTASPAKSSVSPVKPPVGTPTTPAKILAAMTNALPVKARPMMLESMGDQFVADGANVVQVKVDLLERKYIEHQAMKQQKKKTLVDENLTAGQSLEATEQMMNDMRRADTGGVEQEDVSRYQVTLRRWPAGNAPDWTGEVVGKPSFFALKTFGVLVAGKSVMVFDKNNQKLWSANLTYSIPTRYSEDFATESEPPCVEVGRTLYVFDQGMLTSFEATTGDVHWRVTSVGISQVQPDGQGNLYVTSTTASPDSIQFSQQVDLSAHAAPVILKVNGAAGKVLWRTEGIGSQCFVSGKYVYIAKAGQNPLITPGEDPVLYFDLYRLNPSNGNPMWDYSQSRHPLQIEVQGNQILLHFRGELQVLKFLSL